MILDPIHCFLIFTLPAERRRDAAKVRNMVNDSGVKKEHACNWLETENNVHVLVADDSAHSQRDEICTMWEKIANRISEINMFFFIT